MTKIRYTFHLVGDYGLLCNDLTCSQFCRFAISFIIMYLCKQNKGSGIFPVLCLFSTFTLYLIF